MQIFIANFRRNYHEINKCIMQSEQIDTLIELNDELENYFRNNKIPQLFVDANRILRKFTPPAMKQFKLRTDHIGQPLANVKENFRFPTIIDNIQQVIDSNDILEKEIQTTDLRWYQMNILPYIVQKRNIMNGVIISFIDITARNKHQVWLTSSKVKISGFRH